MAVNSTANGAIQPWFLASTWNGSASHHSDTMK